MNPQADRLRIDIANAEARLAELERRPGLNPMLCRQIDIAKDGIRDMRIQLAGMEPRTTSPCPICTSSVPPGWLVCEACSREVPAQMMTDWQCASHHTHAARANSKPADRIRQAAETERAAAAAIISHLRQHGSAL